MAMSIKNKYFYDICAQFFNIYGNVYDICAQFFNKKIIPYVFIKKYY